MTRKVCVITGSRADYGLLRWVMREVANRRDLALQVIAAGSHYSVAHGETYKHIEEDGYVVNEKIDVPPASDSSREVVKSMGLSMISFADAFDRLAPDLLVLLGDRYEIFVAAAAGLIYGIPIAHIHGGEVTAGAFDESLRHSITKMSNVHFVAAETYARRVAQLGENPASIFVVGAVGLDSINNLKLLPKQMLEQSMGFTFQKRNLLITFHPATRESTSAVCQVTELLSALDKIENTGIIFTLPNADPDNSSISQEIRTFVRDHPMSQYYSSLGQLQYLSCMQYVDAIVGNSSSGIIEAPTMKLATINIGTRQSGRLKAECIIDCNPTRRSIAEALDRSSSPEFRKKIEECKNPYGTYGASKAIVKTIAQNKWSGIQQKKFIDLPGLDERVYGSG